MFIRFEFTSQARTQLLVITGTLLSYCGDDDDDFDDNDYDDNDGGVGDADAAYYYYYWERSCESCESWYCIGILRSGLGSGPGRAVEDECVHST